MKSLVLLGVTLIIAIGGGVLQSNSVVADEPLNQGAQIVDMDEAVEPAEDAPAQYRVTVVQYRLKNIDPSELTSAGISAAIKAQNASPVETIMLSATADNETKASFGRRVTVNAGKDVSRGNVTTRKTKLDLGTILNVTLMPEEEKVRALLSFESSRLAGEGTEDSPPDVVSTSLESSQLFDLGQPTLVAASTSGEPIYVLLTVTQR